MTTMLKLVVVLCALSASAEANTRCKASRREPGSTLTYAYDFDTQGRIVKAAVAMKDKDGARSGVEEWSYDAAGRVAHYRDTKGIEHRMTWGTDGRLTAIRIGSAAVWREIRFAWETTAAAVAAPKRAPVYFAWLDRNDPRGRLYPMLFGGASGKATTQVFDCTKQKCRELASKSGFATYDERGRLTQSKLGESPLELRYGDHGPIEMRVEENVTTWRYEDGRLLEVATVEGKLSNRGTRFKWGKTGPMERVAFSISPKPEEEPPVRFEGCRF